MKRMIDNKEFNELKKDVKDVEAHTSDYIINQVVYDSEAEKLTGFVIKDVENSITYNVELGGGEKQLYIHNIQLVIDASTAYAEIVLQIINDSNEPFTKDSLATYATYSAERPINNIIANGYWFDKTNTKQYRVNKLYNYNGLQWNCTDCNVTSVAGSAISPIYANFNYTISDSIIPL